MAIDTESTKVNDSVNGEKPLESRENKISQGIPREPSREQVKQATDEAPARDANTSEKNNEKREAAPSYSESDRKQPQTEQGNLNDWYIDHQKEEGKRLRLKMDENFIAHGKDYYFRQNQTSVAFRDEDKSLVTRHHTNDVVIEGMVDAAAAKGWNHINVDGSDPFKQKVWLEASKRGMVVQGYEPTPIDWEVLERNRMNNRVEAIPDKAVQNGHDRQANVADREAGHAPAAKDTNRYERVVEFGEAPYRHDPAESVNYFVRVERSDGSQREVWGKDLKRALAEQEIQTGDYISLQRVGSKPVEVVANIRDENNKVIGQERQASHLNQWEVERRDPLPAEHGRQTTLDLGPKEVVSTVSGPVKRQELEAMSSIEQRTKDLDVAAPGDISRGVADVYARKDIADLQTIRNPVVRENAMEAIEEGARSQQRFANEVSKDSQGEPIHVHVEKTSQRQKVEQEASRPVQETVKALLKRDNVDLDTSQRVMESVNTVYQEWNAEGRRPVVEMYDIAAPRDQQRSTREVDSTIERPVIPR